MRIFFLTMLLAVCSFPGFAQVDGVSVQVDSAAQLRVKELLSYGEKFLGKPYGYGSTGPQSFDCSGYVQFVFKHFGFDLPHGSGSQAAVCSTIPLAEASPGDLIFFNGRKRNGTIGHVAIVHHWDRDQLYIIHATVQAGVILENMHASAYFEPRFVQVGRIKGVSWNEISEIDEKKD